MHLSLSQTPLPVHSSSAQHPPAAMQRPLHILKRGRMVIAWSETVFQYEAGDPNELQIHATQRQPYLAAQEGHSVNPLIGGHFAFRTDDIEAIKARLTENHIPFDDWGIWSVEGWHQIFLTDPAGNMIEIHQVMTDGEA